MKKIYQPIKISDGTKIVLSGLALLAGGALAWSVIEDGSKKTFEAFCNGAYSANLPNLVHYNPLII